MARCSSSYCYSFSVTADKEGRAPGYPAVIEWKAFKQISTFCGVLKQPYQSYRVWFSFKKIKYGNTLALVRSDKLSAEGEKKSKRAVAGTGSTCEPVRSLGRGLRALLYHWTRSEVLHRHITPFSSTMIMSPFVCETLSELLIRSRAAWLFPENLFHDICSQHCTWACFNYLLRKLHWLKRISPRRKRGPSRNDKPFCQICL